MKKLLISILLVMLCLCGCANSDTRSEDIVILFTNDIHCGINDNLTLAGVAGYKKYMETKSKYVTLVDCGDAIQGTSVGLASEGEISIDAMNVVGYDYAIFGNHEFDFGMPRLAQLLDKANAQYLNCNVEYIGNKTNYLVNSKPYEIKTYGKKKVAFIGVSTPYSLISSAPTNFKEDDETVYDFHGEGLYPLIQSYIDEVRSKGADYVIVLGHLGVDVLNGEELFSATELIENTNGIDALLDGHSHTIYERHCTPNSKNEYVVSGQTGTKLTNLGQLIITSDGVIDVSLVNDIKEVDEDAKKQIDECMQKYDELLNTVLTTTNFDLTTTDGDGVRMVRNRETNIGDFVSDAYRYVADADISYVNGGGVRADVKAGEVTINDLVSVNPFGNMICVVEVTGQEIIDMLEYFCRDVKSEYRTENGDSIGESGSFPCMSGIKFTVDTSIEPSVIVDEKDNLIGIGDTRRVSDVMVEDNDKYVPIDLNKTYTLASHDYLIKKGGSGMEVELKDHTITKDCIATDYEVLIYCLKDALKGDLSYYKEVDNRITIK